MDEIVSEGSHKSAIQAIKHDRLDSIDLIEDDGTGLYRVCVFYKEKDGTGFYYESRPFSGRAFQDLACEAAKRVERLGLSRDQVRLWVEKNFKRSDLDLLF